MLRGFVAPEGKHTIVMEFNYNDVKYATLVSFLSFFLMLSLSLSTFLSTIIKNRFKQLVNIVEKNSNVKNILSKKSDKEKEDVLDELIQDLREINHMKKIEYLESKVAKNLDEGLYSELIKLKSELNRE